MANKLYIAFLLSAAIGCSSSNNGSGNQSTISQGTLSGDENFPAPVDPSSKTPPGMIPLVPTNDSIRFISPTSGATVSNTISIQTQQYIAAGIIRLEYYLDGTLLGNVFITPYLFSLNTKTISDGNHLLMVKAIDLLHNSVQASENIFVLNGIIITSPTKGATVSSIIQIQTRVGIPNVSYVQFQLDAWWNTIGTIYSAPFQLNLDTTQLSNGPHTLGVTAFDSGGNVIQYAHDVIVQNQLRITITSPATGTATSNIVQIKTQILSTAADVDHVEFDLDGYSIGTDTASPYELDWNSTAVLNGTHTLMTKVYDKLGNQAQNSKAILVQNQAGASYSDSFTQSSGSSKSDIVMMIDDSGGMNDNQATLANNISLFANRLKNSVMDVKMMVITSDVSNDAKLRFPRVMNKDDGSGVYNCPNIISTANNNLDDLTTCAVVGAGGGTTGMEEGLEAVRRALDPNYPNSPWAVTPTPTPIPPGYPLNPDFLRTDADLNIIYISDEQDQPDERAAANNSWHGLTGVTDSMIDQLRLEIGGPLVDSGHDFDSRYAFFPLVENHVAFLQSLKLDPSKVHAHAIVVTEAQSSCNSSAYEVGSRYMSVAQLTGGSVSDICGDWSNMMNAILGGGKCFSLSRVPSILSSITTKVNGNTLASNQFSYDLAANQVCLNTIPAAGSIIDISYWSGLPPPPPERTGGGAKTGP